ncbi:hypothetical protein BSLA_02f2941 [Burkholderia stabilis]|nr:hypothetical protein BSLA_02f2941 [Burkholderia stabilis]
MYCEMNRVGIARYRSVGNRSIDSSTVARQIDQNTRLQRSSDVPASRCESPGTGLRRENVNNTMCVDS